MFFTACYLAILLLYLVSYAADDFLMDRIFQRLGDAIQRNTGADCLTVALGSLVLGVLAATLVFLVEARWVGVIFNLVMLGFFPKLQWTVAGIRARVHRRGAMNEMRRHPHVVLVRGTVTAFGLACLLDRARDEYLGLPAPKGEIPLTYWLNLFGMFSMYVGFMLLSCTPRPPGPSKLGRFFDRLGKPPADAPA